MLSDIGVYGLGVMGENLSLNIESRGYKISVYNYETDIVRDFMTNRGSGKNFVPCYEEKEFVKSLDTPRKIFVMIQAGAPVDETFGRLTPLLEPGDIFIDGGNSDFRHTIRRAEAAKKMGIRYVGCGVSGGETGALRGPSLMPGGDALAWGEIEGILSAISAKAGPEQSPCVSWMGADGAGHFVKMVHNGIEYGDMQLICETYDIMRKLSETSSDQMSKVFERWNRGTLQSYLIEITAEILGVREEDGGLLVDRILDRAMQKGTGKWASQEALNLNVPLTLITEAVYARILSWRKEERTRASRERWSIITEKRDISCLEQVLGPALYCAKIISYAQGFALLHTAAQSYGWDLRMSEIARIWRGGCIIRSGFLDKISQAYQEDAAIVNLMMSPYFKRELRENIEHLRKAVSMGVLAGIPLPAMSAALAYYDGYHCDCLPANLLQAQRDYFGGHMVERTDAEPGTFFHYNWSGRGGMTHSSVYER